MLSDIQPLSANPSASTMVALYDDTSFWHLRSASLLALRVQLAT
jgi:hypothetical protein